MYRKAIIYIIIILVTSYWLLVSLCYAQEYKIVQGIVDLHSNISDGLYSPSKLAELAKNKGITILIFADSALRKWEYGLWPLRNLIKKKIEDSSVLRLGAKRYLERLYGLKNKPAGLLIIPGVEASPFYYWEGSPLSEVFSLRDYHKRFLILGLSQDDYQNLPIIGNRRPFYLSKKGLLGFWPILIVIIAMRLLMAKKVYSLRYRGLVSIQASGVYKILGVFFIVAGILLLVNNLSFSISKFNQYQGKQGIKPYQEVIDYVNRKGGLIFWVHPQMANFSNYKSINVYTPSHLMDLVSTKGYTGFSVTFLDKLKATKAGGVWDNMLREYLEGNRGKPVWIVSALHYDEPNRPINFVETVFFLKELTSSEVLNALREGRMYVRFNLKKDPIILKEFSIKFIDANYVQIAIKGGQSLASEPAKIEIIRNGLIFKTFRTSEKEFTIVEHDDLSKINGKAYYRLIITSPDSIIFSNPIIAVKETVKRERMKIGIYENS